VRSEKWLIARGVLFCIALVCGGILLGMLLSSCSAFGGYFGAGGASRYCKDRDGKAIHCPETRDTTKTDTLTKVNQ